MVHELSRRHFLAASAATAMTGWAATARAAGKLEKELRIGLIADLHHDLMPDGEARMKAFVAAMEKAKPDAIVQLGDFAYPKEANRKVIDRFNDANEVALHVLGNHDTDSGHTVEQCKKIWGLPSPYYAKSIGGLTILVLDGNEKGSPTHKKGYPIYIGKEQVEWLAKSLGEGDGPVLILSHQPLAGPYSVDNAADIQELLGKHADRVLLAICGHTHIDYVLRVKDVPYYHVNSASYFWIGDKFAHESFPKAIHDKYPVIKSTCPYKDALFTMLTIDPKSLSIAIEPCKSEWVGPSPSEVKAELHPLLTDGEEVAPRIRDRKIGRRGK